MSFKLFSSLLFSVVFCTCSLNGPQNGQTNKNIKGNQVSEHNIPCPTYKRNSGIASGSNIKTIVQSRSDFGNNTFAGLFEKINESSHSRSGTSWPVEILQIREVDADLNGFQKKEYYKILFENKSITISAFNPMGVIHALASLDFEMSFSSLRYEWIEDWPSIPQRYLQLNLKYMDPEAVKKVQHRMWRGHFNGALYTIHNGVKFSASEVYALPGAMSLSEFKDLVDHGRKYGLNPVPHFDFLSHQNKCLVSQSISPELLFNEQTLDPRNPKIYPLLYSMIDQVDSLIHPNAIHIGHDEVVGHTVKQIGKYGPILPPELYLSNVIALNNYIRSKKIETWMWGDMLLYKDDFPKMHPGALNGTQAYSELIDQIPKDIVLCDWHYRDYKGRLKGQIDLSSLDYFLAQGFRVYGASYNTEELTKQFSNQLYEKKNPNALGMIATTWTKLLKGTINNEKANDRLLQFDEILKRSSEFYWNANKK